MRLRLSVLSVSLLVLCAAVSRAADEGKSEGKFVPLFDGKSLEGWHYDSELWSVKDGVIVGTTDNKEIKSNSFCATKKTYKNFVLKAKFKLRNGNSGIQYRSKQHDNYVVRGYQADIADDQHMGILYEEGGSRGIFGKVDPKEVQKHVNKGDWNEYVITANGNHLVQELNGFKTVDLKDEDEKKQVLEGIIALQIHVGPKMQIEFKDIEIKELP